MHGAESFGGSRRRPDLQPLVLLIQALGSAVSSHDAAVGDVPSACPRSFPLCLLDGVGSVLQEPSLLLQGCHPVQKGIDLLAVLLQLFGSFHLKAQRRQIKNDPFYACSATCGMEERDKNPQRKHPEQFSSHSKCLRLSQSSTNLCGSSGRCKEALHKLSIALPTLMQPGAPILKCFNSRSEHHLHHQHMEGPDAQAPVKGQP